MNRQPATSVRPTTAFWRSLPVFEFAGAESLYALSEGAQRRDWPAGVLLFQRGDPGDYMIALCLGRVRLSVATPDGRELVLAHADAGTILGELALFDAEPRSADATTVTATSGYVVERGAFLGLAARYPDLMPGALRFLCRRLRDTNDKLESIAFTGWKHGSRGSCCSPCGASTAPNCRQSRTCILT